MSAKRNLPWGILGMMLFLAAATDLPAPIYMKYDLIKGEVTATGYKDWIEIDSTQWGVARSITSPSGSGSNREASMPNISEISVTKLQDIASPYLFAEAGWGEGKKVEIHLLRLRNDKPEPY